MFDLTNEIYHDADKAREHLEATRSPDKSSRTTPPSSTLAANTFATKLTHRPYQHD